MGRVIINSRKKVLKVWIPNIIAHSPTTEGVVRTWGRVSPPPNFDGVLRCV